jgi:pimeloyl-ACP methyl ester carboxylesterase
VSSPAAVINSTNVRNVIVTGLQRLRMGAASTFAPAIAIDIASRLFTTPPRFAHTPPELELLAAGTRFDVVSGMGRLAAWRFGDASRDAIVASHGWGGRGAQLRAFVPAFVDAGFQVVVFDHAAHGLSSGDEATLVHFVRGLDAVVGAVESNGARVAGLIGHSLGAAAVTAWLNASRRELRAVLVAPPISLQRYSRFFARRVGISESVRHAMQQRFEGRYGFRWEDFELPGSVAHVRAKGLVIHDEGDQDVVIASGRALARAWPGARFIETKGLGHRRILRDPAVVADTVGFVTSTASHA